MNMLHNFSWIYSTRLHDNKFILDDIGKVTYGPTFFHSIKKLSETFPHRNVDLQRTPSRWKKPHQPICTPKIYKTILKNDPIFDFEKICEHEAS